MPKLSFLVYELLKVKDCILLIINPWTLEQCLSYSSYLVEKKGRTEGGKEKRRKKRRETWRNRGERKEGNKERKDA